MQIILKDFIKQRAKRSENNKTAWISGRSGQAAKYIYKSAPAKDEPLNVAKTGNIKSFRR
jgi:hypothetical protein